jgi:hypothetical protein
MASPQLTRLDDREVTHGHSSSTDVRVRLGGLTVWRLQCTTCRAVCTVLPHFVLRDRQMRPEVACNALLAMHRGLSLELCAVIARRWPSIVSSVRSAISVW